MLYAYIFYCFSEIYAVSIQNNTCTYTVKEYKDPSMQLVILLLPIQIPENVEFNTWKVLIWEIKCML